MRESAMTTDLRGILRRTALLRSVPDEDLNLSWATIVGSRLAQCADLRVVAFG
jgi:hypothetical protein